MNEIGEGALVAAMVLSFILPLGVFGYKERYPWLLQASVFYKAAQLFLTGLILISFLSLTYAFATCDFRLNAVMQHSHTGMDLIYRMAATWGHHEGSMLLFTLILSLYGFSYKNSQPVLWHWLGLGLFLSYLITTSNPFHPSDILNLQGDELNPLLQDPLLIIHPPVLYAGYAGFSVPFYLTLSQLWQKKPDDFYLTRLRTSSLVAWGFLTLGVALGSFWAYYELGWGGWWFWDPVENASLLPWVTGMALFHGVHGAKHHPSWVKGVMYLSFLTYSLALLGFFLVRSGVLSSVHSFAFDPLRGRFLLGILILLIIVAFISLLRNHPKMAKSLISFKDRSFFYMAAIILWLSIAFTLALGIIYPLILQGLNLPDISVGAPYYHRTVIPMGLLSLLPMAIILGLAWQPLPGSVLFQRCQKLFIGFLVLAILYINTFSLVPLAHGIGIFLSCLIGLSVVVRPTKWPLKLAHGGFAFMVLGMCVDSALHQEYTVALKEKETVMLDDTSYYLEKIEKGSRATYDLERAYVNVHHHKSSFSLQPEKRYYASHQILTTKTSIHATLLSHIYVVLGGVLPDGRWTLRISYHPWINLIWLGAFIMALGAFLKVITLNRRLKI